MMAFILRQKPGQTENMLLGGVSPKVFRGVPMTAVPQREEGA